MVERLKSVAEACLSLDEGITLHPATLEQLVVRMIASMRELDAEMTNAALRTGAEEIVRQAWRAAVDAALDDLPAAPLDRSSP